MTSVTAKYVKDHPLDTYYIANQLGGLNVFDEYLMDYKFTRSGYIFPFDFDYFHIMICLPVKFLDEIESRNDFITYRFQVIPYTIDRVFSYQIKSPRSKIHDIFKTEKEAIDYCECKNINDNKRINYELNFFQLYCKLQLNILRNFKCK